MGRLVLGGDAERGEDPSVDRVGPPNAGSPAGPCEPCFVSSAPLIRVNL